MPLPTRRLGRSGPEITRLGFGSWAVGGAGWASSWGAQDDTQSVAAMRHAVERGVSWIDTAAIYGHGHSEELVGRLLRELPRAERPLVFTKCGLRWDEHDVEYQSLQPASIREDLSDDRMVVERRGHPDRDRCLHGRRFGGCRMAFVRATGRRGR